MLSEAKKIPLRSSSRH